MPRKALGKGLDALFGSDVTESVRAESSSGRRIMTLSVNDIVPNRNQPREKFEPNAMEELKSSIRENGILEPPVVRSNGDFYELIAGERRYRAVRELGYDTIEVIVMDVTSEDQMLVLSLVENIQRENLNAIEEAKACRAIMDKMNVTQEQLSGIVGKSRSAVANLLRLLNLPDDIKSMVEDGFLAPGSARALIPVDDRPLQLRLAKKIANEGLSARKAEQLVKKALTESSIPPKTAELSPFMQEVRDDMQRLFGTDVRLKGDNKKGRIEISYYSRDDLERILDTLRNNEY